uniref:ZP domain-containing protein n=1 Tax=Haemonchus contortus TaxID=6289 RepID=A0A7I4YBL0_HAECO
MNRLHFIYVTITALVISPYTSADSLLQDRSVSCSASSMDVSLSFSKDFSGGVFTEQGIRDERCRWRGQGEKRMLIRLSLFNSTECGLRTNETSGEYSIKLIISPVDGLLVDGFSAMSVRCVYSTQDITLTLPPGPNGLSALQINGPQRDEGVITGNGGAPLLSMQILDGHGINGIPVARASVGQRITLDLALKNTAIYDFYVHSCYAHDGTNTADASINIIDSDGCAVRLSRAVDAPVFTTEPINHGPKHVYLHMYGFQFTSSQFVHFECQVKPCVHSCRRQQCEPNAGKAPLIPALRRRREEMERNATLTTLKMQTVLEIEPQQVQRAAFVAQPANSDHCVSLNEVVFVSLLLLGAIVSLVALSCFMCSPTKRSLPREEPAYTVSKVFQR